MNTIYSDSPSSFSTAIQMNGNQAVSGQFETLNYFERSGAVLLLVIAALTGTYVTKLYYSYKQLHTALSKETKKLHPIIDAWYSLSLLNIIFLFLVLISYACSNKHLVISYILLLMGVTGLGAIIISTIVYVQILPTMKEIQPNLVSIFKRDLIYEIGLGALVTFIGLSTWFLTYNCDCVDVRYNKNEGILTQRMNHANVDSVLYPTSAKQQKGARLKSNKRLFSF